MKSYWLKAAPSGVVLQLRAVDPPLPADGQVRVRVKAAALNRGEFIAGGLHRSSEFKPGGFEMAGEIETAAHGGRFPVGVAVLGACLGAFSEYVCVDEAQLMPLPGSLSWVEGAAVPVSYLTAYDALCERGGLREGETVLIAGASSAVGLAALQLGKALGARVIGTSGDDRKLAAMRQAGLDVAVHTRGPDIAKAVHEATEGLGADLAINNIGGSVLTECLAALAFEGRLAVVGYVDERQLVDIDLGAVHRRRLSLFGVSAQLRTLPQRRASVRAFESDVLPLFDAGRIRPLVDAVYDFDDLESAKIRMESNAHLGKLVITI